MADILNKIRQAAAGLDENTRRAIDIDIIAVESGAIGQVAAYLKDKSFKKK